MSSADRDLLSDELRAKAIARYEILDTPNEKDFDDIVKIAAEICGTPVSLITLIDKDRQWFKAEHGAGVRETPLELSVCRKLLHLQDVSVVPDASKDSRFDDNELVSGDFHLRFYAGAPLQTPDGVAIGMLCVLDKQPRDLTVQQGMMLKALARQVMVQLELRSALLEQSRVAEDLVKARNAAEEANAAKTEFLANMSHEIRTPMNAIIGLSSIIGMSGPLNEKQAAFIKTLKMSADMLLTLVNDLLDITKIEAKGIELEQTPFDLPQLIQEVMNMLGLRAKEKDLVLTLDSAALTNRMFLGDSARIRQIILNLCSNAIKFTERGNVTVAIKCFEGADPERGEIEITVSDSGIGIAPNKIGSIFEKFTQGDASINRKYGGTGLGLAITKTLVEIMGGTIKAQSTLGMGSMFTIRLNLPKYNEEKQDEGGLNGEDSVSDIVLLVEDYEPNILVAQTYLTRFGYASDVAVNGLQAVEKVQAGNYAAVLMDMQMHCMNGLDATIAIRKWEKRLDRVPVPIIGMTANAFDEDRRRCLEAGMDDYIAKPFDPAELQAKLKIAIKNRYVETGQDELKKTA